MDFDSIVGALIMAAFIVFVIKFNKKANREKKARMAQRNSHNAGSKSKQYDDEDFDTDDEGGHDD